MKKSTFQAHGKLLLTGEYLVLDGAEALALPTKKGQSLTVEASAEKGIDWESFDVDGKCWFSAHFNYEELKSFRPAGKIENPRTRLLQLLAECQKLNPAFLAEKPQIKVTTLLGFDRNWGLGSSSTLVHNLAQWAEVDPYLLLEKTFGGSGYDLACAASDSPIIYQIENNLPQVKSVAFDPDFKDQLFFVYLNQKKNSREAIAHYRSLKKESLREVINAVNALTLGFINAHSLSEFEAAMDKHEQVLSHLLKTPTIKTQLFPDYLHSIKSLGGWGGDFVLVTGSEKEMGYFRRKRYGTIVPFGDMLI